MKLSILLLRKSTSPVMYRLAYSENNLHVVLNEPSSQVCQDPRSRKPDATDSIWYGSMYLIYIWKSHDVP